MNSFSTDQVSKMQHRTINGQKLSDVDVEFAPQPNAVLTSEKQLQAKHNLATTLLPKDYGSSGCTQKWNCKNRH